MQCTYNYSSIKRNERMRARAYLYNEDLRANGDEDDGHEDRIPVQASPHIDLVPNRTRVELVVQLRIRTTWRYWCNYFRS